MRTVSTLVDITAYHATIITTDVNITVDGGVKKRILTMLLAQGLHLFQVGEISNFRKGHTLLP
jgi:pentose-5-phosphate-3-epimerase